MRLIVVHGQSKTAAIVSDEVMVFRRKLIGRGPDRIHNLADELEDGSSPEGVRGVIRADRNPIAPRLCGLRSDDYRLGSSRGLPIIRLVRLPFLRQRWM